MDLGGAEPGLLGEGSEVVGGHATFMRVGTCMNLSAALQCIVQVPTRMKTR